MRKSSPHASRIILASNAEHTTPSIPHSLASLARRITWSEIGSWPPIAVQDSSSKLVRAVIANNFGRSTPSVSPLSRAASTAAFIMTGPP